MASPDNFTTEKASRCIYCGSAGPFNEEHVFPAGLGGDDSSYVLKDCVCETCNSTFSKLETKLMRSSPEAIPRVFFNASGRARGGMSSTPRLEIPSATYVDPDTNTSHEIEVAAGGSARLVPQIAFLDAAKGQLKITGSVKQEIAAFFKHLRETFGDEVALVQKHAVDSFSVTTLALKGSLYIERHTDMRPKPPPRCIWLERFLAPLENESVKSRRSLLLQRPRGQVALRLCEEDSAAECLSIARIAAANTTKALEDAVGKDVEKPGITLRFSIDEPAWIRVQLKIGANLAYHVFGAAVDTPDMLALRHAVRFGSERLALDLQEDPNFLAILNLVDGEHHLMMLTAVPVPNSDRYALVFGLRLFNGVCRIATLAEDFSLPVLGYPRVFCVRYRENRIEELSMLDLAKRAAKARSA